MQGNEQRQTFGRIKRVVIKVGTRVLVDRRGRPDARRMDALVRQMLRQQANGRELVLVSSGAIGAGIEALKMPRRPQALPDLQMAAAVGQSRLMARYQELFGRNGCTIGQVLLTHDDLRHRVRHLNARNTVMNLLRHRIVPIVNENDVVSVDELRVGDNDQLAALVSMLVDAELLVLLSGTNGLRAPAGSAGRTRRVPFLPRVTREQLEWSWGKGSQLSIGGMATKLQAAQAAADTGTAAVIADGRMPDVLDRLFAGDDVGTLIGQLGHLREHGTLASKKRWIAFFQRAQGKLVVDDGAARAITEQGRSLLPIGIRSLEGQFEIGAMVNVHALDGRHLARGLVEYSATEIAQIKGHRTGEIAHVLGSRPYDEVIHRDNMVVFDGKDGAHAPAGHRRTQD